MKQRKTERREGATRRDFLRLAGTGVPVLTAMSLAGARVAEAGEAVKGHGIRMTEHMRKYYESLRF